MTETEPMQTAIDWEGKISDLLGELSSVQDELLNVLDEKRRHMASGDVEALAQLQPREELLGERLQQCHLQRQSLLAEAHTEGLPADSISQLASVVPRERNAAMRQQLDHAKARTRLLRHQSLTNWVLAQRSLLHLSQLLEIFATGGRGQPTYGDGETATSRGALVDEAA